MMMAHTGCQLDIPGKRALQLRNFFHEMAYGTFSLSVIDVGGLSSLWQGPSLSGLAELYKKGN